MGPTRVDLRSSTLIPFTPVNTTPRLFPLFWLCGSRRWGGSVSDGSRVLGPRTTGPLFNPGYRSTRHPGGTPGLSPLDPRPRRLGVVHGSGSLESLKRHGVEMFTPLGISGTVFPYVSLDLDGPRSGVRRGRETWGGGSLWGTVLVPSTVRSQRLTRSKDSWSPTPSFSAPTPSFSPPTSHPSKRPRPVR